MNRVETENKYVIQLKTRPNCMVYGTCKPTKEKEEILCEIPTHEQPKRDNYGHCGAHKQFLLSYGLQLVRI